MVAARPNTGRGDSRTPLDNNIRTDVSASYAHVLTPQAASLPAGSDHIPHQSSDRIAFLCSKRGEPAIRIFLTTHYMEEPERLAQHMAIVVMGGFGFHRFHRMVVGAKA